MNDFLIEGLTYGDGISAFFNNLPLFWLLFILVIACCLISSVLFCGVYYFFAKLYVKEVYEEKLHDSDIQ